MASRGLAASAERTSRAMATERELRSSILSGRVFLEGVVFSQVWVPWVRRAQLACENSYAVMIAIGSADSMQNVDRPSRRTFRP